MFITVLHHPVCMRKMAFNFSRLRKVTCWQHLPGARQSTDIWSVIAMSRPRGDDHFSGKLGNVMEFNSCRGIDQKPQKCRG